MQANKPLRKSPRKRGKNRKRTDGGKNRGLTSQGGATVNTVLYEPWMPIFPARATKWLRYSTSLSLTSASGVVSTQVFRANDLFDPDFTSTGHQPMGFDQLMSFYNHFCVIRSRIHCIFKCNDVAGATACIRLDADSTPLTVIDRILEFGGLVTECLESKGTYGANKELTLVVDIPKIQGVPIKAILADVNLRGTAASSPSEVTYFHVALWNTSAASTAAFVDVILEQQAVFTEPRDLTTSVSGGISRLSRPPPLGERKSSLSPSWEGAF